MRHAVGGRVDLAVAEAALLLDDELSIRIARGGPLEEMLDESAVGRHRRSAL
jgi:hypothetical protein